MAEDTHVEPQDAALQNSPKVEPGAGKPSVAATGDGYCYWNGNKYSDGASVCDNHIRYECWSGKWVDIGQC